MKWFMPEPKVYKLDHKGWSIAYYQHFSNDRHSFWRVTPDTPRMCKYSGRLEARSHEWRSGLSTGLRRAAHVMVTGESHWLTKETRSVPPEINDVWYRLEESFEKMCGMSYWQTESANEEVVFTLTDAF